MRIENKEKIIECLVPTKKTVIETVFIADDGTEFDRESSCKKHEEKINDLKEVEKYIQQIKHNEMDRILPYLLSDTYKVSDVMCFKHKITNDSEINLKIITYLDNKRCHYLNPKDFDRFLKNDDVLIVSWTEDEDTQYTKIFLFVDVILFAIDKYRDDLKYRFFQ